MNRLRRCLSMVGVMANTRKDSGCVTTSEASPGAAFLSAAKRGLYTARGVFHSELYPVGYIREQNTMLGECVTIQFGEIFGCLRLCNLNGW